MQHVALPHKEARAIQKDVKRPHDEKVKSSGNWLKDEKKEINGISMPDFVRT